MNELLAKSLKRLVELEQERSKDIILEHGYRKEDMISKNKELEPLQHWKKLKSKIENELKRGFQEQICSQLIG